MVITPWPHVDKKGRLCLRVDLTGVKSGRGALWHDVLWFFFHSQQEFVFSTLAYEGFLACAGGGKRAQFPRGRLARLQRLPALGAGPLRDFRAG